VLHLADFAGVWRFERAIENAVGPDADMQGTARFTDHAGGLMMHESGEMRLAGQGAFLAERRYLWRAAGGHIAVFFDDGRPFHDFDPAAETPQAEHPCAPDHYRVAYDFGGWPEWRAVWQVTGPRKSYVMRSRFFR